jgi:proteasome accessory factor C
VPASSVSLIDHVAAGPAKERADGRMDVPVRVGNPRWLGRLLLRLGPDAEVVYPEELRHVRSLVASAALSRYQTSTGT